MPLFCLVLIALLSHSVAPQLISTAPSNVYLQGHIVKFALEGFQSSPVSYSLADYAGRIVKTGAAVSTIIFPALPAGYYTLTAAQGGVSVSAPAAVVYPPHPGYHGPIAVDSASAWLVPPDKFSQTAEILHLAGFGTVRERLSWGQVEPARGQYNWGKYDSCITAESENGISVDDIFHDCPSWARADHAVNRFPDDLRDAYNFARTLAEHYRGKVKTWEVWNEADGGFSVDMADQYAAFLKACYLGFKSADPDLKVAQVSMAGPAGLYEDNLFQNDTQDYFDIYNYHVYANPSLYPQRAEGHFATMRKYGVGGKPVWVTEAGIFLHEVNNELTPEEARVQADFIPKSYAMSLANGSAKHFFFVFPHYLEPGVEWGVLTEGMLPYPGYCALAASTHFLGSARYLGAVSIDNDPQITAESFANGEQGVLVMWSNGGKKKISIETPLLRNAKFYNVVGSPLKFSADQPNTITVGASPIFVDAQLSPLRKASENIRSIRSPRRETYPHPGLPGIVVRTVMPDSSMLKLSEVYSISANHQTPFHVQVYNFSKKRFDGVVTIHIPEPWHCVLTQDRVIVNPMGLASVDGYVRASQKCSLQPVQMLVSASMEGNLKDASSPECLMVAPDPGAITPVAIKPLFLNSPNSWHNNISGNGVMTIRSLVKGGVQFDFQFNQPGDRWAFPIVSFKPAMNFSAYDAIRFEYKSSHSNADTIARLMVGKPNGSTYFTEPGFTLFSSAGKWKRVVIPFKSLVWGPFSSIDPEGSFHARHVSQLLIGCNTTANALSLSVRNIELVRYAADVSSGLKSVQTR